MDVVNQQDVGLAIFFPESDELIVLDRVDVFVREFLRRDVRDARAFSVAYDVLTDGVQQMCLAQTHAPIKEQRIIGFARRLGDSHRRRVSETVVVADDESVECVLRVESVVAATGGRIVGRLDRLRFGCSGVCGERRSARRGNHSKPDSQGLAGSVREDILDQTQIIVLEPDLAEIVGYLQSDLVALQHARSHRREPEIENVGVEHRAQHFLRCSPCLFSGGRYDRFLGRRPNLGRFIHLAL